MVVLVRISQEEGVVVGYHVNFTSFRYHLLAPNSICLISLTFQDPVNMVFDGII